MSLWLTTLESNARYIRNSGILLQIKDINKNEICYQALPFAPLSAENVNFTANAANATTPEKPWQPKMRRSLSGIARK